MKQKTVRLTPKMARALLTYLAEDSLDYSPTAVKDFEAMQRRVQRFVDECYPTEGTK